MVPNYLFLLTTYNKKNRRFTHTPGQFFSLRIDLYGVSYRRINNLKRKME